MSKYYEFRTNKKIILPRDFFQGILFDTTEIESILSKGEDMTLRDKKRLDELTNKCVVFMNKYGIKIEVVYSEENSHLTSGTTYIYFVKENDAILPLEEGDFVEIYRNTDKTFTLPFVSSYSNYNYVGKIVIDTCKKINFDNKFRKVSEDGIVYDCFVEKGKYTEKEI